MLSIWLNFNEMVVESIKAVLNLECSDKTRIYSMNSITVVQMT